MRYPQWKIDLFRQDTGRRTQRSKPAPGVIRDFPHHIFNNSATIDLRAVHKDWPVATRGEAVTCREGGRRCPRCQAMLDAGVNPYTMEPLARYDEEMA